MPSSNGPFTAGEIARAIEQLHAESVAYWNALPTSAFLADIAEAWSPAENVRHLTKSMRAVTTGLRLPRLFLRFKFGTSTRSSRDYVEMRADYRKALVAGVTAGRFTPGPRNASASAEAERLRIMHAHEGAMRELCDRINAWPERALDRLRLPHPILGPVTVREMLLFTLYHNRHHLDGVRAKLAKVTAE